MTKISRSGYKKNSKDKNQDSLIIPSNNITMKNVGFPVLGTDNLGNTQMMYPGMDYVFPGTYVHEIPIRQAGGNTLVLPDNAYGRMRKQAYADSLSLYNQGENYYKQYLDFVRVNSIPETSLGTFDNPVSYKPDGSGNPIQPIKGHGWWYEGGTDKIVDTNIQGNSLPNAVKVVHRYKKPTQPISFEPRFSKIEMNGVGAAPLDYNVLPTKLPTLDPSTGYLTTNFGDTNSNVKQRVRGRFNLETNTWQQDIVDSEGNLIKTIDNTGATSQPIAEQEPVKTKKLRKKKTIQMPAFQDGGDMPFDLPLRSSNPGSPWAYESPQANGYLLPDVNRLELLNTGATEYKMGVDDITIPTVVDGNYMDPEQAYQRYLLTGEKFKEMTDPRSYSEFYNTVGNLGLMRQDGGPTIIKSGNGFEYGYSGDAVLMRPIGEKQWKNLSNEQVEKVRHLLPGLDFDTKTLVPDLKKYKEEGAAEYEAKLAAESKRKNTFKTNASSTKVLPVGPKLTNNLDESSKLEEPVSLTERVPGKKYSNDGPLQEHSYDGKIGFSLDKGFKWEDPSKKEAIKKASETKDILYNSEYADYEDEDEVDYLAGIKRLFDKEFTEENPEAIFKDSDKIETLPQDNTEYGYNELYTVPDKFSSNTADSLQAFTNTFDNTLGAKYYIGHKEKELSKGAKRRFENSAAVAHFLRDADVLPDQKYAPEEWDVAGKGIKMHSTSKGKALSGTGLDDPDKYRMMYKKNEDGSYNVKYEKLKNINPENSEGWEYDLPVSGQHRYSDIDWDGEGDKTGFKIFGNSTKWVPLKDNAQKIKGWPDNQTRIPYKDKNGFSRFSGGSVVYIFKDPKTGKTIGIDVAGSINTLKKTGQDIIKKYNISGDDIDVVYHDMGSYSAKPAAQNGVIDYRQWTDYNSQNRGFSGAPLIIPSKHDGGTFDNSGQTKHNVKTSAQGYYEYINSVPLSYGGNINSNTMNNYKKSGGEAFPQAPSMNQFFNYGTPTGPYVFAKEGGPFPQILTDKQFFSPGYANVYNPYNKSKGGVTEMFPQAPKYLYQPPANFFFQEGGQQPEEQGVQNRIGAFVSSINRRASNAIAKIPQPIMQDGGEKYLTQADLDNWWSTRNQGAQYTPPQFYPQMINMGYPSMYDWQNMGQGMFTHSRPGIRWNADINGQRSNGRANMPLIKGLYPELYSGKTDFASLMQDEDFANRAKMLGLTNYKETSKGLFGRRKEREYTFNGPIPKSPATKVPAVTLTPTKQATAPIIKPRSFEDGLYNGTRVDIAPNNMQDMSWAFQSGGQNEANLVANPDMNMTWDTGMTAPNYTSAGFAAPLMMGLEEPAMGTAKITETDPNALQRFIGNNGGLEQFWRNQGRKGLALSALNSRKDLSTDRLRQTNFEDMYSAQQMSRGTYDVLGHNNLPYKNNYATYDEYSPQFQMGGIKQGDEVEWDQDTINRFLQAGGQIEYID